METNADDHPVSPTKLHGRIIDQGGAFTAECWTQTDLGSPAVREGLEAQSFSTMEEARAWIERRSQERGFGQVWMDS